MSPEQLTGGDMDERSDLFSNRRDDRGKQEHYGRACPNAAVCEPQERLVLLWLRLWSLRGDLIASPLKYVAAAKVLEGEYPFVKNRVTG
jgi:hypothetical protein